MCICVWTLHEKKKDKESIQGLKFLFPYRVVSFSCLIIPVGFHPFIILFV